MAEHQMTSLPRTQEVTFANHYDWLPPPRRLLDLRGLDYSLELGAHRRRAVRPPSLPLPVPLRSARAYFPPRPLAICFPREVLSRRPLAALPLSAAVPSGIAPPRHSALFRKSRDVCPSSLVSSPRFRCFTTPPRRRPAGRGRRFRFRFRFLLLPRPPPRRIRSRRWRRARPPRGASIPPRSLWTRPRAPSMPSRGRCRHWRHEKRENVRAEAGD
mmetsp:Transcript_39663/g.119132  ORF Transcript_39663/g.119132 Transcript_39663/m.119132 type:complete len:215 (+) Transcript_39663:646-1290(+)